jgi:transposase
MASGLSAKGAVMDRSVVAFADLEHFAGFDWATTKHDVVVVDRTGKVVLRLEFANDAQGWLELRARLSVLGKVGIAIETSCGPEVERLLDMGHSVYPMNPKAAQRYRDRKAPSGVKDDQLDAWSFADALRSDGHAWRSLRPQDPQTQLLRLLCRDEIALIEQRTALVLQLRAAAREYYDAALEAFDDWTLPAVWDFLIQFPTPAALISSGKRRWEKFLHSHRLYRPQTVEKRLEVFARANHFASPSPAVTSAKSLLVLALARQLRTLQEQINEYRRRIDQAFDEHPDRDIFKSLPAAGEKLAPRLAAELGDNRDVFESAQALQCYGGTAPVTQKSGKRCWQLIRRSCNKILRTTVHLWVDLTRRECAWAQSYYQSKREQGLSHPQALRCLGQRWLKILWRMWIDHTTYNEVLHMRNMTTHGSWVLQKLPALQA